MGGLQQEVGCNQFWQLQSAWRRTEKRTKKNGVLYNKKMQFYTKNMQFHTKTDAVLYKRKMQFYTKQKKTMMRTVNQSNMRFGNMGEKNVFQGSQHE